MHKLSPWTNKFNLFDVLKISKTEIRHSNMLAFILDPNENHNLKDYILRGLFEIIALQINSENINIFDILLMNFYEFKVQREWKNIDILLVSDHSKVVICIENKVFSSEHSNQLNRYKKIIDEYYPAYTKFFLFLTPQGGNASDNDTWLSISYSEILELIERAILKKTLSSDVELLIKNYIDIVRWHIVGDENLIKICNEIYKKHKRALDLIYENKSDNLQEISDFILKYISTQTKYSQFFVHEQKCNKSYIRFTSDTMSEILPNLPTETSGWKTNNYYFYEITNKGGNLRLHLSVSRGNFTEVEYNSYYDELFQATKVNDLKKNWSWKILVSWNVLKLNDEDVLEEIEETLVQKLDDALAKVCVFEDKLIEETSK